MTPALLLVASFGLAPAAGADEAPAPPKIYASRTLPILLDGGKAEKDQKKAITRTIRFGAPGVWYLWVRASAGWPHGAVLTWDLDGKQPLRSGRSRIQVPPYGAKQWLNQSMFPLHKASVHVDAPGEHTLRVWAASGDADLDRIALTLFFSASPLGDTLDHSQDPGGGRAEFPVGDMTTDGFREDRPSPAIKALRSFYVDDAKGDDGHAGTSPAAAWRTPARVNVAALRPGDAVLFRRGGMFRGGVAPRGSGTPANWITLGAYGTGARPVIDGGANDAVRLQGQSYWIVQDLALTSEATADKCGLAAVSVDGGPQPKGLKVYGCVAWDNGNRGMHAGPSGEKDNGYDGALFENCLAFCNGADGIQVHGQDQVGARNGVIRFCTAWENRGSGGIWMDGLQNGLIERCVAYNNIVINIWAWNAINVTMRECETWRGHEVDAGGYDIDWGSQACVLERCYAHHNEGVGYLMQGSGWIDYRGYPEQSRYNLMRHCISEHDGGAIGMVETYEFGIVHNNLAVSRNPRGEALGIGGWPEKPADWYPDAGGWPSDTMFWNNVLVGQNGAAACGVDDFAARQGNRFDHNAYWVIGSAAPLITWGGRSNGPRFWWGDANPPGTTFPPDAYRELDAFRKATGEELHGLAGDPGLTAPGEGGYGRLPLNAYRLRDGAAAKGKGRPVVLEAGWLAERAKFLTDTGAAAWGIPMAPAQASVDYWGRPLDPAAPSIGPYQ